MARAPEKKAGDEARLERLERAGLIRRGKGDMREWLKHHKPIKVRSSVLQALLEERESGW
jgi:hypothetical protein